MAAGRGGPTLEAVFLIPHPSRRRVCTLPRGGTAAQRRFGHWGRDFWPHGLFPRDRLSQEVASAQHCSGLWAGDVGGGQMVARVGLPSSCLSRLRKHGNSQTRPHLVPWNLGMWPYLELFFAKVMVKMEPHRAGWA